MDYKEFNKTEIEEIAEEFNRGVVIPAGIKKWYEYKKAVQRELAEIEQFEEIFEGNELSSKIMENVKIRKEEASNEMSWIKSVKTYDLKKVCEYLVLTLNRLTAKHNLELVPLMAEKVLKGVSEVEEQMVRELIEESQYIYAVNAVRELTRPISERTGDWGYLYNNPSTYYPVETPCDATELYNGREHYIYVHSENEARWGQSYWISVNCGNTLESLPIIKAFKDFEFEIGKFYKVICTDTVTWGNGKKKYLMDISEVSEEDFMNKGFVAFCKNRY